MGVELLLLLPLAGLPVTPLWDSVNQSQQRALADPATLSYELVCERGKGFPPNTCKFPLLEFDPVGRSFKWPTLLEVPKEYQGGSVLRFW